MAVTVTLDRRHRRQPRRHDLPPAEPAPRRPGHRRDDLLDVSETAQLPPGREVPHQAHHPHRPGDGQGPAVPPRHQHAAPRRDRRRAGAQRDRSRAAAHHGAAVLRRVPAQPRHGQLHPHRRGLQQHRRRRHDPRPDADAAGPAVRSPDVVAPRAADRPIENPRWPTPNAPARTSSGTRARSTAPIAGRAPDWPAPPCGSPACRARASPRWRSPSSASCSSSVSPATCSTATTCATASTATSASARRTATRTSAAASEVARLFADAGVIALVPLISPYRAGRERARERPRPRRPPVRRGLRQHPDRGVRGPRPQGSLPPGPRRRDHRLHRHRRPLRGTPRSRARGLLGPGLTRRASRQGHRRARPPHRSPEIAAPKIGRGDERGISSDHPPHRSPEIVALEDCIGRSSRHVPVQPCAWSNMPRSMPGEATSAAISMR